jgi:hypothetical protein
VEKRDRYVNEWASERCISKIIIYDKVERSYVLYGSHRLVTTESCRDAIAAESIMSVEKSNKVEYKGIIVDTQ